MARAKPKGRLSVREAAQVLKVSPTHVYSLVWAELLRAEKRDGRWHVNEADVQERKQRLENWRSLRKGPSEVVSAGVEAGA